MCKDVQALRRRRAPQGLQDRSIHDSAPEQRPARFLATPLWRGLWLAGEARWLAEWRKEVYGRAEKG